MTKCPCPHNDKCDAYAKNDCMRYQNNMEELMGPYTSCGVYLILSYKEEKKARNAK